MRPDRLIKFLYVIFVDWLLCLISASKCLGSDKLTDSVKRNMLSLAFLSRDSCQ
jgi:hypothetical protein